MSSNSLLTSYFLLPQTAFVVDEVNMIIKEVGSQTTDEEERKKKKEEEEKKEKNDSDEAKGSRDKQCY
mgnify:CR=1 FL=1